MTLVTREEIVQKLEELSDGAKDVAFVEKIQDLCYTYGKSAEEMVDSWLAFISTQGPTKESVDNLNLMERKVFLKKKKTKADSSKLQTKEFNSNDMEIDDNDLLENQGVISSQRLTNVTKTKLENPEEMARNIQTTKYQMRTNKGDVVVTFGSQIEDWKSKTMTVTVDLYDSAKAITKEYPHMYSKLRDREAVLNRLIENKGELVKEREGIEELSPIGMPTAGEFSVLGRVCCDSDAKLNLSSILLEGPLIPSSGAIVPLIVNELPKYSLFPGQIISGIGINNCGNKIIMKSFNEDFSLPLPKELPVFGPEALDIVVACGPFTIPATSCFDPLKDLIDLVLTNKPHALILVGPFFKNKTGSMRLQKNFQEMFDQQISFLKVKLKGCQTACVLVPSENDPHIAMVYPTPPYKIPAAQKGDITILNASDPAMINIGGVVIGVTSQDILRYLAQEEIAHTSMTDKLGRLASHLLSQQSFYPLYPPSVDTAIDYQYFEVACKLNVSPHILITPSDMRYFIKNINGTCCINPERMLKGIMGGTFAQLRISSPSLQNEGSSIIENISGEIVRI